MAVAIELKLAEYGRQFTPIPLQAKVARSAMGGDQRKERAEAGDSERMMACLGVLRG